MITENDIEVEEASERDLEPGYTIKDESNENILRPKYLKDFQGQEELKENLKIYIEAAKKRGEALDHIFLQGPPGLGKTTLATIIANEMGTEIKLTSATALEKPKDLVGILTNLTAGSILFIDEIHGLKKSMEETLYVAMEDYKIDWVIGQGPSARTMKIDLEPFTLIGATTRTGAVSKPLENRFGIPVKIDLYPPSELELIIRRSAKILNVKIKDDAVSLIATCSRGTPRIANRILRRVRDFAVINGNGIIDKKITEFGLDKLSIDKYGLDKSDREILKVIIDVYDGGPVGLEALAASINDSSDTIEVYFEPYLMRQGYLKRTTRGRCVTDKAYEVLGREVVKKDGSLFWGNMKKSDFYFDLPEELIAQSPSKERGDDRLLVLDKYSGSYSDMMMKDFPRLLSPNSVLVVNNTKVRKARVYGIKSSGSKVEFMFLNRVEDNLWTCITNREKKQRVGDVYSFYTKDDSLYTKGVIENVNEDGSKNVRLEKDVKEEFFTLCGHVPLPPYIKREDTSLDDGRYQTIYAKNEGSVAAPTAGLHFTEKILSEIKNRGIDILEVTLSVGEGTFLPVRTEDIEDHKMHSEDYYISDECAEKLEKAKRDGKKIVAVGTTSVRTLESASDENKHLVKREGSTRAFIYPGYKFKFVDELLTNFHTPESTLLMLVSALAGRENILSSYKHAVKEKYKFFSYGDAMYIKC